MDELKSEDKKIPYEMMEDSVKWLLIPAKIFLHTLGMWPDCQNKISAFVNFFCITSFACLIAAQLVFILDKDTDVGSAADAIMGLMSSAEAGGRRLLCVILAKRVSKIIHTIYYDFWPSNIAGEQLHEELNKGSWILAGSVFLLAIQAFAWVTQAGLFPLSYHKLPLSSKFWFSFMSSPFYEVLYIWETFMCMDLAASICAIDFFLSTLIWHCVAQFKLVRGFLKVQFVEITKNEKNTPSGRTKKATKLILVIILQHNKLIKICKDIEGMLTVFILILYLGTVGTLCLSSFLLTVVKNHLGQTVPYFLGHMILTFIYCYVGNELILESAALANAVAECGWHLLPHDNDLRKSLVLIMVRAQRPLTLSVGGFGVLNVSSYMALLQFSFSVYTVLSKSVQRNEQH